MTAPASRPRTIRTLPHLPFRSGRMASYVTHARTNSVPCPRSRGVETRLEGTGTIRLSASSESLMTSLAVPKRRRAAVSGARFGRVVKARPQRVFRPAHPRHGPRYAAKQHSHV
eukprot:scaffold47368_cov36-Tisochrysis_lutea.AAC.2